MTFSWERFLDRNGLEYVETGANVSKDWLGLACPLCGDDPSQHLGVSKLSGAWHCWRDTTHSGRSPTRLVQALLGISWDAAKAIVEDDASIAPKESWGELRSRLTASAGSQSGAVVAEPVVFPQEFFPLSTPSPGAKAIFRSYLARRGFSNLNELTSRYKLRGALSGEFNRRLIFPFYQEGELLGWTARSVSRTSIVRYKTECACQRRVLYNYDQLLGGGKRLVLVEGPIDALKLDFYGASEGWRAGALLGLDLSHGKMSAIARLAPGFDRIGILLDRGAQGKARKLAAALSFLEQPIEVLKPTPDVEDPGDMSWRMIEIRARRDK